MITPPTLAVQFDLVGPDLSSQYSHSICLRLLGVQQ